MTNSFKVAICDKPTGTKKKALEELFSERLETLRSLGFEVVFEQSQDKTHLRIARSEVVYVEHETKGGLDLRDVELISGLIGRARAQESLDAMTPRIACVGWESVPSDFKTEGPKIKFKKHHGKITEYDSTCAGMLELYLDLNRAEVANIIGSNISLFMRAGFTITDNRQNDYYSAWDADNKPLYIYRDRPDVARKFVEQAKDVLAKRESAASAAALAEQIDVT